MIASASTSANDRWHYVLETQDGKAAFYIDVESVKFDTLYPRAWELTDHKDIRRIGQSNVRYFSSVDLKEYNCKERSFRLVSSTLYSKNMGGGNVVSSFNYDIPKWDHVVPSTISEHFLLLLCNASK